MSRRLPFHWRLDTFFPKKISLLLAPALFRENDDNRNLFQKGIFPSHIGSNAPLIPGWINLRLNKTGRIECTNRVFLRRSLFRSLPFSRLLITLFSTSESGGESERNDEKMYGTFSEDLQPHFWGHATFQNAPKIPAPRTVS